MLAVIAQDECESIAESTEPARQHGALEDSRRLRAKRRVTLRLGPTLGRADKRTQCILLKFGIAVITGRSSGGSMRRGTSWGLLGHLQEKALTVMAFACDVTKAG